MSSINRSEPQGETWKGVWEVCGNGPVKVRRFMSGISGVFVESGPSLRIEESFAYREVLELVKNMRRRSVWGLTSIL